MSITIPGTGPMTLPSASALAASPATGDRSAAIATMQKFADEFPASLASNGYQKLPNGLIIQWGLSSTSSAGTNTISLPTAFSNTGYRISCSPLDVSVPNNVSCSPNSTTAFNSSGWGPTASNARVTTSFTWIAIGY
jgi:hypothetical protein